MTRNATLIPGDGIGPEVTDATVRLLEAAGASFNWDRQLAGMAAVKEHGDPMPDNTLASIKSTALALKGPLETPVGKGFRSINVALRKEFDYAIPPELAGQVDVGTRVKVPFTGRPVFFDSTASAGSCVISFLPPKLPPTMVATMNQSLTSTAAVGSL